MPEIKEFRMPDLGIGPVEADVVSWTAQPGDRVDAGDRVVDVEVHSAKSIVQIPATEVGVVAAIHAPTGTRVSIDSLLASLDVDPVALAAARKRAGHRPARASWFAGLLSRKGASSRA
ncbi:biotin/lipoyl-containing protein [Thalassiella azotivora]